MAGYRRGGFRRRFRRFGTRFRYFGRRFRSYGRRFRRGGNSSVVVVQSPRRRRRRRSSTGSRRIALQLGRWKLTTASLLGLAALGGIGYWLYNNKKKTGKWL